MISKIKGAITWAKDLRQNVTESVLLVEREFHGKSGPEKRKIVVERLDALVKLPWVLDELLDADGVAIGLIVDKVCNTLNILTDGKFADIEIDVKKLAAVVEAPRDIVMEAAAAEDARAEAGDPEPVEPAAPSAAVPTMPASEKWKRCIGIVGVAEGGANFDVIGGKPVLKEKSKNDRGGPTKYGVTQVTLLKAYADGVVGHADIIRLTKAEAETIYRAMYCDPYNWLDLPFEACLCLLDATINHGLGGTSTISQRACNAMGYAPALAIDGKWGPKTRAAVWALGKETPLVFAGKFLTWRKDYFDRIIAGDPTQERFRGGWYNRLKMMAKECGVASPV